jgi:hypothetical protein
MPQERRGLFLPGIGAKFHVVPHYRLVVENRLGSRSGTLDGALVRRAEWVRGHRVGGLGRHSDHFQSGAGASSRRGVGRAASL